MFFNCSLPQMYKLPLLLVYFFRFTAFNESFWHIPERQDGISSTFSSFEFVTEIQYFSCNAYNLVPLLQRFIMILTEHLVRCETDGTSVLTPWYKNCIERLQQIFLQVCEDLGLNDKHHYSQPQRFLY